jgi:phage portal protein BeeE
MGNTYINLVGKDVFNKTPTTMYVLPSQNTKVAIKGMKNERFEGDFRSSELLHYVFVISESPERTVIIPKEQMLHLRTINPNYKDGSFLYGISPLVSAQYPVNAIYSGYSAKVGLYQNGPKTILSPNFPGNAEYGSFSLPDGEQIEAEQKRLQKYGLEEGQWQTVISKIALNANRLSYNISELRINENNIKDIQAICSAIGIDSRLLGDPSSSTFSNQEQSEKKFFQGTFMAYENNFFNDLTQKVRTYEAWKNRIIKPDFSDIPQLAESEQDLQDILLPNVEKGLMTREQYLMALGESTEDIPNEFREYYTYNNGTWIPVNSEQNENIQEL